MLNMKTRSTTFALTAIGLGLFAAAEIAPVQAQSSSAPLVTVTPNAPTMPRPPGSAYVLRPSGVVLEVEKLAQSGTDPAVLKAFIQSWQTPYSVSADDILRLHDRGVPSDVLTSLIQHGAELGAQVPAAGAANMNPVAVNPSAPAASPWTAPTTSQPTSPAPPAAVQYVAPATYPVEVPVYSYPAYPVYSDSYYYSYPYYYPSVSIGLGFGFRGYGGYRGGYGGYHGGYGGYRGGIGARWGGGHR